MTTHEMDALRALHEQAVAEGQRLSAEVARLREERDELAGVLRECVRLADQPVTASGSPSMLSTEDVRRLVEHSIRYVTEPAREAINKVRALASPGSPQDERSPTPTPAEPVETKR
jgi:hypothetical protein